MVTREEAAHALVGQPFAFEVRGGLLTVHTSASVKGEQWKQRWQQCMRDVQRGDAVCEMVPVFLSSGAAAFAFVRSATLLAVVLGLMVQFSFVRSQFVAVALCRLVWFPKQCATWSVCQFVSVWW